MFIGDEVGVYMNQTEGTWQGHQSLLNEFGELYLSMAADVKSAQQQLAYLRAQRGKASESLDSELDAIVRSWEKRGRELVDYSRSLQPLVYYEAQHI